VIYLDYNASTPLDARVLDAMLPYFIERHGNASSTDHASGANARSAVETAREHVARLVNCDPEEIVFTSGATEANNLAILGTLARAPEGDVLVSAVEHPAVLGPSRTAGDRTRLIPVDERGVLKTDALRSMLSSQTALVCVMAANNETGAIQPVDEVAALCAEVGVPLHVDAAQAAARLPLDVSANTCATLSLSAHKMYGPQGVGALFIRRRRPRSRLTPVIFGGGHERNLRPGTLNVPGIVGLGEAARLVCAERQKDSSRESGLRSLLVDRLAELAPTAVVDNAAGAPCLPQTVNLRFVGVRSAAVLRLVSTQLAISTGSACSTTSVEPSHVLLAQGLPREAVAESLRLSFGRPTTATEIEHAAELLGEAVRVVMPLGRTTEPV
jgi:cysteine desulfurase